MLNSRTGRGSAVLKLKAVFLAAPAASNRNIAVSSAGLSYGGLKSECRLKLSLNPRVCLLQERAGTRVLQLLRLQCERWAKLERAEGSVLASIVELGTQFRSSKMSSFISCHRRSVASWLKWCDANSEKDFTPAVVAKISDAKLPDTKLLVSDWQSCLAF